MLINVRPPVRIPVWYNVTDAPKKLQNTVRLTRVCVREFNIYLPYSFVPL